MGTIVRVISAPLAGDAAIVFLRRDLERLLTRRAGTIKRRRRRDSLRARVEEGPNFSKSNPDGTRNAAASTIITPEKDNSPTTTAIPACMPMTARAQMRRVEQHQQLTEAFASDVSHEFKNPLASIRTATEMLSTVEAPEDRARFLRIAEMEIARMENLLAQVREITRIDAEIQSEERASVDLGALLRQIVEGFGLRMRDRVQFDVVIPDTPLMIKASPDRLIQVFENLLDNAVSFTPNGGRIAVSVSGGDRAVLVSIRDQGPGIPPENLERIFDRFFTYRPTEQQRQRHTGLGLSIVKAIVEGYGGAVTVTNGLGGGAVFDVTLPAE